MEGERSRRGRIRLKRVYADPADEDGFRILVDQLWPRGLTRERAAVDLWLRDVAPSTELRKWFAHAPAKWDEFVRRYWAELEGKPQVLEVLRERMERGPVTLVYASRDEERNNAVALKAYLERGRGAAPGPPPFAGHPVGDKPAALEER